ncbi:MAG: membrane-bound lytic murein transglycosylase D [Desulfobacteraceae bacterium Eth-SRB2]|nr:MAG: membrane-bound lytic murein transglycosylase D [Desulfobacteraceae bacterium Eth-SRB2]
MGSSDAPTLKVRIESGLAPVTEFVFTDRFRIGRHSSCQLQIKNKGVSRYHADVFIEDGHWWIQDLQSGNGVFIDDRKIDRFPLSGTIRIRLGVSGPGLIFELEKAVPLTPPVSESPVPESPVPESSIPEPTVPESPVSDSRTLSDYKEHYFGQTLDDTVGEHTLMVRQAYAEVKKKQRWMYVSIISVIAVLCILTGGYALYKHRQVRQQRELAADIFYNMKTLEIEIGKVIKDVKKRRTAESKKQIEEFRAKQQQLEQNYNRFVDTLNVYGKGLSQEERIILHISRRFGECEVNMPEGFIKEVMKYVEKWKSSQRLERAIKRARSRGYIPEIVQTLSMYNLPPQFFYLALQESNLNPNACGPETRFGIAKGMWQFIPSTAEAYDLNTGPLVDERIPDPDDDRHDFRKSTLAAAKYLKDIYTTDAQASGLLVMASYNWGEDRVIKLIESMPENPRERNFWQLISQYRNKIPDQTYDYVFSIFSAAVIGENPRLFGYNFDNPLAWEKTG